MHILLSNSNTSFYYTYNLFNLGLPWKKRLLLHNNSCRNFYRIYLNICKMQNKYYKRRYIYSEENPIIKSMESRPPKALE